jgi:hypothetical protein
MLKLNDIDHLRRPEEEDNQLEKRKPTKTYRKPEVPQQLLLSRIRRCYGEIHSHALLCERLRGSSLGRLDQPICANLKRLDRLFNPSTRLMLQCNPLIKTL